MFLAIAAAALVATPAIAKEDLWMVAASGDTRRIRPVAEQPAPKRKPLVRLIPAAKPGSELAAIIARVKREHKIRG
jgi:hypothetical protein